MEVATGKVEVKRRWTEYFEELLNVLDDRVQEVGILRNGVIQSHGS